MKGNISKNKGFKGNDGHTPSISFRYDASTGLLEYTSDGILLDKEYVDGSGFARKDELADVATSGSYNDLTDKPDISGGGGAPLYAYVNIKGGESNWVSEVVKDNNGNTIGYRYGQTVNVNNAVITPNSKVDLQISSEQMVIFYEKYLAFVAENEDGVVTIYCIGQIPQNDYTIQATVTEVVNNG